MAGFALLILVGGLLLRLPISHTGQVPDVSLIDALFTAASAVTVTGLAVVDTGTTWSPFGEFVIIVLIQFGGLGIMTMAGFIGLLFNQRLGARAGKLAGTEIGFEDMGALRVLIRRLVIFVFTTEAVVAALLTLRFWSEPEFGFRSAANLGIFHSVSAFNNAGFSILDHGLERYAGDWFVSLVIAFSFIIGGLGFPVVFDVWDQRLNPHRWTLHTKVTLVATAALLILGTLVFAALEWTNELTLAQLGTPDRFLAAFFQSATTRTAGFNTVPTGDQREASLLLMVLLMVIGASSASTGGGIKTSSLAVVIGATISELRGDDTTSLFGRRVPSVLERQALSLVIAALGGIGTTVFVLSIFQPELSVLDLLFESASAFATAGLSTGVTPHLTSPSRALIIVLMFVGRVGPTTFGAAVMLRPTARRYGYPEEGLIVG